MATQRNNYSAECKARVALEALKERKRKKHLQTELPQIFSNRRDKREQGHEELQAQLYQQIGQLKIERWCRLQMLNTAITWLSGSVSVP